MTRIIGIGHQARQGKDTAALFIKEQFPNTEILHFADGVYREATNAARKLPLFKRTNSDNGEFFDILVKGFDEGEAETLRFAAEAIPSLKSLFDRCGIDVYWGMDEKDGEVLQIWGTDFRRKFFGYDFWVKMTMNLVEQMLEREIPPDFIIIPDTRFYNEVEAVRNAGGDYVKVYRRNPKTGEQFLATDRNNNHVSETELLDVLPDYTWYNPDGDLGAYKQLVSSMTDKWFSCKEERACDDLFNPLTMEQQLT